MKTIQFRAWEKENKRWVYLFVKGPYVDCTLNADGSLCDEQGELEGLELSEWYQYTGLKDRNGKEIYEGDIMKINGPTRTKNGKVRKGYEEIDKQLRKEYGPYCIVEWSDTIGGGFTGAGFAYYDDGKVVGNIIETPKLLKAK